MRMIMRTLGALLLAVLLFPVYLLVNEYLVWGSAHQLARDLSSEKQQNLDAAWKQYQKLSSRSHFPISLWAARDELQQPPGRRCRQHHREVPVSGRAAGVRDRLGARP